MKLRSYLVVLTTILVLLSLWLVLGGLGTSENPHTVSVGESRLRTKVNEGTAPMEQMKENDFPTVADGKSISEKTLKRFSSLIEFYGLVVDEKNLPVESAAIIFTANDLSSEGSTNYKVNSKADGTFSIDGIKGGGILVHVEKEGYYGPKGDAYFYYSDQGEKHIPDRGHPAVFKLQRKGPAAELIKGYSRLALSRDGKALLIDLISGQPSSTGQLQVQAWTSTIDEQPFDWKVLLSMASGGIHEYDGNPPYVAPETGYLATFEVNMPKSLGEGWKTSIVKRFYLTFGSPKKYARIAFRISGVGENCFIDYYINPDGGRNLEYSESKEIQVVP